MLKTRAHGFQMVGRERMVVGLYGLELEAVYVVYTRLSPWAPSLILHLVAVFITLDSTVLYPYLGYASHISVSTQRLCPIERRGRHGSSSTATVVGRSGNSPCRQRSEPPLAAFFCKPCSELGTSMYPVS